MKTFAIVDEILNIRIAEFLAMGVGLYYYRAYLEWTMDVECPEYWDYIIARKHSICKARRVNPMRCKVIEL